jgi:hypothetical protein
VLGPVERRRDIETARGSATSRCSVTVPFCEPIQHSVGRLCPAWISTVFDMPLLGEGQVRLGNGDVAGPLSNAVPECLQIADLLCL